MVNLFSTVSIGQKIFSFFSQHSKEMKEEKLFLDLLAKRYQLPPVREVSRVGSQYGGGYFYEICTQEWANKLAELIHEIMIAHHADEEIMETCGYLALFIVVLPRRRKRDEGACYGQPSPYDYLRSLQSTETWRSLFEMGRGRGSDYSLVLIKRELEVWLGTLTFDLLSRRQSTVRDHG